MNVIANIHGGAFMFGSGNEERPDYLLKSNDVVFVTIYYRLGPLGATFRLIFKINNHPIL